MWIVEPGPTDVVAEPHCAGCAERDQEIERLIELNRRLHDSRHTTQSLYLLSAGWLLMAFSTSGNSPNILEALDACKAGGITTIGLTGAAGGAMAALCELCIRIPSDSTPRIQESHIVVGHAICAYVEEMLFGAGQSDRQSGVA